MINTIGNLEIVGCHSGAAQNLSLWGDAVFCELFLACWIIVPSPSEWSNQRRMTVLVGLLIQWHIVIS